MRKSARVDVSSQEDSVAHLRLFVRECARVFSLPLILRVVDLCDVDGLQLCPSRLMDLSSGVQSQLFAVWINPFVAWA